PQLATSRLQCCGHRVLSRVLHIEGRRDGVGVRRQPHVRTETVHASDELLKCCVRRTVRAAGQDEASRYVRVIDNRRLVPNLEVRRVEPDQMRHQSNSSTASLNSRFASWMAHSSSHASRSLASAFTARSHQYCKAWWYARILSSSVIAQH